MTLGIFHTSLYHQLRGEGRAVSREFNKPLITYISLDEATRKRLFDQAVDDELLARGIIESVLYSKSRLIFTTNDTNKFFRILRKLSSQLSLKDIEEISETSGKQGGKIDIIQELEARGIKVPKNEEEMDKLVGPYKK